MDINILVNLIKNDLKRDGSYDRYPTRFLSMRYEEGTSTALIQIQMKLERVEIFDIKDILPHDDGWITADSLRKAIYSLNQKKSYIIIGFSEYARFLNTEEFITLLISFLELENSSDYPKRRIYIPCFALYSQMKKIIKTYHRKMDVYNPLLNETDVEDLPRIFFIEDGLSVDCHYNEVLNSSEWFGMWRNTDIDTRHPIICSSSTLAHFYTLASPDNIYNIQRLKTYQDILKYMYFIENLHGYKNDEDGFYSRLINLVKASSGKKLSDIILLEVNAQNIDATNVYNIWKAGNVFKKWLIQNYILMNSSQDTYLYKVMDSMEDLTDKELIEKVYEKIFEYKDLSLIEERCCILTSIRDVDKDITFTNQMIAYYNAILISIIRRKTTVSLEKIDFTKDEESLFDKREILTEAIDEEVAPYLTFYSKYERQLIVWLYRMHFIDNRNLQKIYPVLWSYVNDIESGAEPVEYADGFDEYFGNYRKMRLSQISEDKYEENLRKWNSDENSFYDWYLNGKLEYPEVYLKKKNFTGTVYVLDGIGAEFLAVIVKMLEKRGYITDTVTYGKCHLPSITSVAQSFYSNEYQWITDYDSQVIHGGTYYNVDNIEKSLSVIERLIERIISIEGNASFAITADHGATVGHKLQKKDKRYNFEKSEHDGRCFCNKDGIYIENSNDYILYDDESGKQWIIALNQQSLYNNSKYEVHGGATLEEVLIPVIMAYKGRAVSKSYKVSAVSLKVSGLQKRVEFRIVPTLHEVTAILQAKDGTNAELSFNEETKTWSAELKRGIEQDIEVTIGNQVFKFRSIPTTKMGDDLFDE